MKKRRIPFISWLAAPKVLLAGSLAAAACAM